MAEAKEEEKRRMEEKLRNDEGGAVRRIKSGRVGGGE